MVKVFAVSPITVPKSASDSRLGFSSSHSSSSFLRVAVAATASATACVVWHVAYSAMVLHHRKKNLTVGSAKESDVQHLIFDHTNEQSDSEDFQVNLKYKDDVELFVKDTPFHRKLLEHVYDSGNENEKEGLLSEPPWGLLNNHLASLSAQFRPSPYKYGGCKDRVVRRQQHISLPIGDALDVEFFEPVCETETRPDTWNEIPMILLLHGINGHSTEPYIEQAAIQIVSSKGWRCVVLNYSKLRVLQHMEHVVLGGNNFMDSGDVNFLISHLRKNYAHGFLGAVGFSMGGAKLIQYLGRTGIHSNVDAAACVSSPLDFTTKNETVWRANSIIQRLYHLGMSGSLKLWILRHYRVLKSHPRLSRAKPLRPTMSGLLWWFQATRVTDIDEAITIHARGYPSLNEYYSDATAIERLRYDVKTPFLCITAKNDPFIPRDIVPDETLARDNSNVVVLNTNRLGGHIGYWLPFKGCWATKRFLTFFASVQDHQDLIYQEYNEEGPMWQHSSLPHGVSCQHHHKHIPSCIRTACNRNPKELHRKNSLYAAKRLQKTSSTNLTDYMQLVDIGGDSSVSSFGSFFGLSSTASSQMSLNDGEDHEDHLLSLSNVGDSDDKEEIVTSDGTGSTLSESGDEGNIIAIEDHHLERRQDDESLRQEEILMFTTTSKSKQKDTTKRVRIVSVGPGNSCENETEEGSNNFVLKKNPFLPCGKQLTSPTKDEDQILLGP